MLHNELIIAPIAAWFMAQFLKTVIYAIENRSFDFSRMIGDGGMPSGHSSTVSALATACALCYGMGSFEFAMSGIFAVVVMRDASGIRLESGKQAKAINEMLEYLKQWSYKSTDEQLEELLGHTPFQVICGCVTGITTAFIIHFSFFA